MKQTRNALNLTLFTGRFDERRCDLEIHNSCFRFWKSFWSDVYAEAGSADALKNEEFFRQDVVGFIRLGERPIAMWANTFFDVRSEAAAAHSYFKMYTPGFAPGLLARRMPRAMTLEFFTVDPAARGNSVAGASLGRVLSALSLRVLARSQADAIIAVARTDVGAAKIAYEGGYECSVAGRMVRNFTVDEVFGPREKIRRYADDVERVTKALWDGRVDYTEDGGYAQNLAAA